MATKLSTDGRSRYVKRATKLCARVPAQKQQVMNGCADCLIGIESDGGLCVHVLKSINLYQNMQQVHLTVFDVASIIVGMMSHNLQLNGLLETAQVAQLLGVSPGTVRRWVDKGRVSAIALPSGRLRFRRVDIEALLEPRVGEVSGVVGQSVSSSPSPASSSSSSSVFPVVGCVS